MKKSDQNEVNPRLTVDISLPSEQVQLLNDVKTLLEQLIAAQTNSHYLTEEQAAEALGISKTELSRWRSDGIVRYKRYKHKLIRYKASELFEDFEIAAAKPATYKARYYGDNI